jgi:cytochrome c oxidase subunit 1
MDTLTKDQPHHDAHDAHGDHHEEMSFWQKYIFATDHKVIGYQYMFTSFFFLLFGFALVMLMRWQLAYPGKPLPILGNLIAQVLGDGSMPGGVMVPEFYNALGAMHGTIMIFLGIVPLAFAAFGNFCIPLQIGSPDMAFPKINAASYWSYFVGGIVMFVSFWAPGGAAQSGWTSYTPLAVIAPTGQTLWIIGMVFLITSSLLGAINFISTIIQCRAPGMTWMRLPFLIWTMLVTSFLLVLAFPPLEAAGIMQLMDRVAGTSFFMPEGLVVSAKSDVIAGYARSGGGSTLLWQHLFWFLGHPEVYVLILPAMGIVAEVIAANARRPIWGYRALVFSTLTIGFLSFIVWAHHMYMTGMGARISVFFQTTTVLISVPSVLLLTCLILSLWGGSIRFTTSMLFAVGFLPMFGIGGLTGLPLAFNAIDLFLHDTYYVIGHFHYVVAPGTIFALFAGVYHWYPKATGRKMNEALGKLHFWGSFVCMNCIFTPMMIQGMQGVSRRLYDGGETYLLAGPTLHWNLFMSVAAWTLALFQIPFLINFFLSMKRGEKASDNPWEATTLEWSTATPPPHGNWPKTPTVYRSAYEYSVPGAPKDYTPQSQP